VPKSHYLKLRDRAAYEFALASAAVVLKVNGNKIESARIALGGVGTRPWRSLEAERRLKRKYSQRRHLPPSGRRGTEGRAPGKRKRLQGELAKRCIVRALTMSTTA